MILFIKLLFAHLAGDFILQPGHWASEKETKKLRSPRLYIHALLHGALAFLLVWQVAFWKAALVIAGTHLIIDAVKVLFQNEKRKMEWFLADQLLHVAVLAGVWYVWEAPCISIARWLNEDNLILLTAIIILTKPTSIIIKLFISKWAPYTGEEDGESLRNAGKYIGILERLFVLAFVVTAHWEAVGFLIAAKSVFRYGDLKEQKDRKLTEYILIGTLLSFGLALLTSMLAAWLIQM